MSNLSNMRKKIDAMRMDREAWTARMRQIDADREARKLKAKKSVLNRLKVWLSKLLQAIKVKFTR
ncbi:MAG: hypothetical protein ACFB2W_22180 [Leptolyngbyaceae cyanobacterium]